MEDCTDPLLPPTWRVVDRLLDEVLPHSSHPSSRQLMDDAITQLVIETETLAVKRHGQVVIEAIFGDRFQQMSELCDDR
jgi:hypothetical protein